MSVALLRGRTKPRTLPAHNGVVLALTQWQNQWPRGCRGDWMPVEWVSLLRWRIAAARGDQFYIMGRKPLGVPD